jgi:hypothetical protein
MRRERDVAAALQVERVAPSTTVAKVRPSAIGARTSSRPAADTILRIWLGVWLALSILLIAVASMSRALAIYIPGARYLSRVRGSLALAGAAMLLAMGMGYVIFLFEFV